MKEPGRILKQKAATLDPTWWKCERIGSPLASREMNSCDHSDRMFRHNTRLACVPLIKIADCPRHRRCSTPQVSAPQRGPRRRSMTASQRIPPCDKAFGNAACISEVEKGRLAGGGLNQFGVQRDLRVEDFRNRTVLLGLFRQLLEFRLVQVRHIGAQRER
jgi:hypothetical protein